MTWNQTHRSLRNLLAQLYPTEEDARRVVDDAGLPDIHIQFRGSAANMWHNILKDADRRHKIPALIDVARTDYPERTAELQQLPPETPAPRAAQPPPPEPEPPSTMPDTLTIDSPIALDLVRVPAGQFLMGSDATDEAAHDDEFPPHTVYLPEFHIGKYPVTNMQYLHFVRVAGHRLPDHWKEGNMPRSEANHPVTEVSWRDALAFCAWLSRETGQPFRLPSEAEWEKAARGTGGRIYPWGNEWDVERCNSDDTGLGTTTPVGHYAPAGDSPYGCADMAGNVWEWTRSLWGPGLPTPQFKYPYDPEDGRENLQAGDEVRRVVRGGSFDDNQSDVRCAFRLRNYPLTWSRSRGFRVVLAPR